ncbi:MAG TPA: hypothetical protein VGG71_12590 [Chitinophagaceae bacterium]
MKPNHKTSMFVCALIIVSAALCFSSCQKEADSPVMDNVNAVTSSNVAASSNGATTSTVIVKVPIVFSGFFPCANGGNGEIVDETGIGFFDSHVTINENRFIMNLHWHSTAETGIGEITGDSYVARFVENSTTEQGSFTNGQYKTSVLLIASSLGVGSVPNLRYGIRANVILNANGTMTVSTDVEYMACE